MGDAVSVGAVAGSAVWVGSVVPVGRDDPVLVWALTTTPPVTVLVVLPDDVVPLSGSDVVGVFEGSVEVCVSAVVFVPVVVVVFVLVSVVPLVGEVSDDG
jgi:hypothetical protein